VTAGAWPAPRLELFTPARHRAFRGLPPPVPYFSLTRSAYHQIQACPPQADNPQQSQGASWTRRHLSPAFPPQQQQRQIILLCIQSHSTPAVTTRLPQAGAHGGSFAGIISGWVMFGAQFRWQRRQCCRCSLHCAVQLSQSWSPHTHLTIQDFKTIGCQCKPALPTRYGFQTKQAAFPSEHRERIPCLGCRTVSPTRLCPEKGAVSSHSSRTGAPLEPATLRWATAVGSEHRQATSNSISVITDELFHLPAVPPPRTRPPGRGSARPGGHTAVSPLPSHPALLEDPLVPFLGLKNPAEQEQLKALFTIIYGTKPESFLQGVGDFAPSIRHLFISPFLYSVKSLQ